MSSGKEEDRARAKNAERRAESGERRVESGERRADFDIFVHTAAALCSPLWSP